MLSVFLAGVIFTNSFGIIALHCDAFQHFLQQYGSGLRYKGGGRALHDSFDQTSHSSPSGGSFKLTGYAYPSLLTAG